MDLSIIIVNYNVKEFLQNLIHSIRKAAQNLQYEIIIVDNASMDGSVECISEKFHDVHLIANTVNKGFGKANNQALKIAKGNYFLLINPDSIVSEDTLVKMISFFETHPAAGLAGCKILNPDGTLQLACRRSFPGPWTSFCKVTGLSTLFPDSKLFARYNLTYKDENKSYEVDAISGSFMMMKREVYEKIGGFDEDFFMYGEDLDLCYRIQKAGYKVFYVHETQVIHYKGESTRRSSLDETKFFYDAMHLFVKKHLSSSLLVQFILRTAIGVRKILAFLGRRKLVWFAIILDFIFYDLSLFLSEIIYQSIRPSWTGFPQFSFSIVFTIPALSYVIVASIIGVYRKNSLSILKSFAAIVISFFILSSLTFFFKEFAYSRAVVILTYLILFLTLVLWRVILKLGFKVGVSREAYLSKRTLIVGIKETAVKLADTLNSRHVDYHTIAGLISLTPKEIGQIYGQWEVVGSLGNIIKVIRERKIDEVIFSPQELSYSQMMSVVSTCQNENTEFKIVGNNLDFLIGKASVSVLDEIPLIEIRYNITSPVMKFLKTAFDYTLAVFILFLIYPFIYLIARAGSGESDFKRFILGVPLIFTGKVSFVGPKDPSGYKDLFLGKKGLTGLWYIDTVEDKDVEKLDILYAKNQNIWFDLEILAKSLNKMLTKNSGYG
ncbi:MAG TPA: glycosyltransferase [Ignavibacteriaceae bacterium]|nr:glycosyltransferase [Ignavibacteriaceae bacterium]